MKHGREKDMRKTGSKKGKALGGDIAPEKSLGEQWEVRQRVAG